MNTEHLAQLLLLVQDKYCNNVPTEIYIDCDGNIRVYPKDKPDKEIVILWETGKVYSRSRREE